MYIYMKAYTGMHAHMHVWVCILTLTCMHGHSVPPGTWESVVGTLLPALGSLRTSRPA